MEPRRGLEPRSPAYETGTSPPTPARHTYGAESGSPTRLTCLEDKCLKRSANPAYCKAIKLLSCQRTNGRGAVNRTPDFLLPKQAPSHWATPRKSKRPDFLCRRPGRKVTVIQSGYGSIKRASSLVTRGSVPSVLVPIWIACITESSE